MHTSSGSCDFTLPWCRGLITAFKGRFGDDQNLLVTIAVIDVQPSRALNVGVSPAASNYTMFQRGRRMVQLSHEGEPQTFLLDISIKPQTFCYTYMQHFFSIKCKFTVSEPVYQMQLLGMNW